MAPYEVLVVAVETASRFLEYYVAGDRRYTTQDVRTGIERLWGLCQELKQADYPDGPAIQRVALVLSAAGDCLAQARRRLEVERERNSCSP
jgi:hypothetical protein